MPNIGQRFEKSQLPLKTEETPSIKLSQVLDTMTMDDARENGKSLISREAIMLEEMLKAYKANKGPSTLS